MENNSSTLSIGTESLYTVSDKNQSGGFFSSIFGSSKEAVSANLALEAFNDKYPQVACYIIGNQLKNNESVDLSTVDSRKRNILHHLVVFSKELSECKNILVHILSHPNSKQYVNLQDDSGNTPAHYALYTEQEDVVELLIQNNADLSIKNNQGFHIALKPQCEPQDVFVKVVAKDKPSTRALDDNLASIVSMFTGASETVGGFDRPDYNSRTQSQSDKLLSDINSVVRRRRTTIRNKLCLFSSC
jgi:hypothetical protein